MRGGGGGCAGALAGVIGGVGAAREEIWAKTGIPFRAEFV